jgi:hypothetical protein
MHDIRIAVTLIALVSVGLFLLSLRLLESRSKRFLDCLAAILVVLTFAYGNLVWGQLWIVNWIPLPSVIVLSNWFAPLLAVLAAVVWLRLAPASAARRLPIMLVICAAGIYATFYFIPLEPPLCQDEWAPPRPPMVWPVCLQTTPTTCSAAAAATILNCLEIKASEQEMAKLCLTRSGTTWLGLYHGLATKLWHEEYRVEFFESDVDGLSRLETAAPVLLCCELEPMVAKLAPEYVQDGGWIPGTAHSVVYFGRAGDRHVVGDPSRGYETWSTRDLNNLWRGTGLRVVRN